MNCVIDDFNALHAALHTMTSLFSDLPEEALFNCKLVASELISNALQYGGGHAQMSVDKTEREIRITVKSAGGYRPPEKSCCADVFAERGRGLYLVDALASSRGYSEEEGISVVVLIEK